MSQQMAVPSLAPEDTTPDPMHGWDGGRASAAGLHRMSQRPPLPTYLRELWQRREFIMMVPRGNLRQQHMNTALGSIWHLLSPMLMSGVYFLVFGVFLGARGGIDNYAIYLVAGVLTYRFTQKCVQSGARTIVNNQKMLQSLNFPAAVLPLSAVITETLSQMPALLVLCMFAVATAETPHIMWLALVPLTMLQGVFNFGLAAITARVTVHFRDTEEILQYILRLGFYTSGVIFGIEQIQEKEGYGWAEAIFVANPIYQYIELVRGIIYDGVILLGPLAISLAWTIGLLIFGFVYFWRFEGRYGNVA